MRVLLLNQYYSPDLAPTGQALHQLGRALAARGHSVHVIASRRAYSSEAVYPRDESLDGIEIRRVHGTAFGRRTKLRRVLDYLSYLGLATIAGLRAGWRPDLVLTMTTPPYLGLAATLVARLRGAALAHWVMDLYPDTLVADGILGPGSVLLRVLEALSRLQFRGARAAIALGPFMSKRVSRYTPSSLSVDAVPLWSLGPPSPPGRGRSDVVRAERGWSTGDLVLLYSGNMGRGHRFGEFVEGARRLGAGGPLWAFVGDGPRRAEVERAALELPQARIQMLPYVPADRLVASLAAADVHLVSLDQAWQGLIVPSKLQGSFAVGRTVIFVGGRENEVAAWIEESGGGRVVGEGDVDGLLAAVESAKDPAERARRGAAALAYAHEHFDRERNCGRIADVLEKAAARSFAPPGKTTGGREDVRA